MLMVILSRIMELQRLRREGSRIPGGREISFDSDILYYGYKFKMFRISIMRSERENGRLWGDFGETIFEKTRFYSLFKRE